MPINAFSRPRQGGITLIELIVFIVVMGIALTVMVTAMNSSLIRSVDPVMDIRALECAQAKLDEVVARRFDKNSPMGGIPACGSTGALACAGIASDSALDNVGAYADYLDPDDSYCGRIEVSVSPAGVDLGLSAEQARLITVRVQTRGGGSAVLSTYRANF